MATNQADVVVIGGGVVGCATAWYATRRGASVLLVEKESIGRGASGRTGGGIRQSSRVSEEIPLAIASVAMFPGLSDELGLDIEYRQAGNLRLIQSPEFVPTMQADIVRQQKLGLDVRWLQAADVAGMGPALSKTGILGASFCPTDGHVNPFRLTAGFFQAARRAGAKALIGHGVERIAPTDGGGVTVQAGPQTITAGAVVIAAGAGSAALCRSMGVDLPLTPFCHQSMITEPLPPLFAQMFGTLPTGLYFRQTAHGGVHFGGGGSIQREEAFTNAETLHAMAERMAAVVPALRHANIVRAWSGIDAHTPDKMPVIDKLADGVWLATGFSGHGLALGPMVGRLLADWLDGGDKPALFSPFGAARLNAES